MCSVSYNLQALDKQMPIPRVPISLDKADWQVKGKSFDYNIWSVANVNHTANLKAYDIETFNLLLNMDIR